MVGSRFTNKAESNYAPIEGELLAVTYGLKKTRYYTLGSEKLTVCVDHKPLLGVLGETELEKIDNTRLEKLKEKNLGWRFRVVHAPEKSMPGTDALVELLASFKLVIQVFKLIILFVGKTSRKGSYRQWWQIPS